MRYYGEEFMSNFTGAVKSGDRDFQQDMVLDRIAHILSENPEKIRAALKKAGTDTSSDKKDIIAKTSQQLYINPIFQHEVAKMIHDREFFNSAGAIIGSVSAALAPVANIFSAKQEQKVEQERTRQQLLEKVYGDQNKRNYIPVIAVGSVLLIATIVVIYTLRSK